MPFNKKQTPKSNTYRSQEINEEKSNPDQFETADQAYFEQKYQNSFPIEIFPPAVQELIKDLARTLSYPKEFLAGGILVAISAAIGKGYTAQYANSFTAFACIFLIIVGRPGSHKSSPLEFAFGPLLRKEGELLEGFAKEYEAWQKNGGAGSEPVPKRLLANDTTMEAVLELLQTNSLTIYSDEFKGFLNSMNKYRSGDDVQKWLQIWSGSPVWVDRKGKPTKRISKPVVNCVGTIQTSVLLNFISNNYTGNGFNERLLFITSDEDKGIKWSTEKPNEKLVIEYDKIITNILDAVQVQKQPEVLLFSESATAKILEWQHYNDDYTLDTNDERLRGVNRKLEIYLLRFCLILAIVDYAAKSSSALRNKLIITLKHVERAITLAEYFRSSAHIIYSLSQTPAILKEYKDEFRDFYDDLPESFTTTRALRSGAKYELSRRTVFNYLNMSEFIVKLGHGKYKKRYIKK